MDKQTSAASDAPQTMLEKQHNSTLVVDQPENPDPPASTTEARSEDPLRLLVTVLTVRVLNKCHAFKNQSQEECVARIKRLVHQTMEGFTITKGVCPDAKSAKRLCKSVMKDLQKKFCGKRTLETLIILQDPLVDKVIVQSLQAHIRELSARLTKKRASLITWKDVVELLVIAAVTLTIIFLALLVL